MASNFHGRVEIISGAVSGKISCFRELTVLYERINEFGEIDFDWHVKF